MSILLLKTGFSKLRSRPRLRLTDAERVTLAEIAHRLGRKALEDVANVMKPDTLHGLVPEAGSP